MISKLLIANHSEIACRIIRASEAGVVEQFYFATGDVVGEGVELLAFTPTEDVS